MGHQKIVQLLIEKSANVKSKDRFSQTPLSWAAEIGHQEIVQLLIEKGAQR
jgi:ankyrin repeat protein